MSTYAFVAVMKRYTAARWRLEIVRRTREVFRRQRVNLRGRSDIAAREALRRTVCFEAANPAQHE